LCMILHDIGGCDAYPWNQPFTREGKIAFVDTEDVGKRRFHDYFIQHIVPALNEELQPYAVDLWMKLEEKGRLRNIQLGTLRELEIDECLLPKDHPLHKKIEHVLADHNTFKTLEDFKKAGFHTLSKKERKIMVGKHPALKHYLVKKFGDIIPQKAQLL